MSTICNTIGLPDVLWRHYIVIKQEMELLKKLQQLLKEELRKPQEFLATCNLDQCRMTMRLRTGLLDIPEDMPGGTRPFYLVEDHL